MSTDIQVFTNEQIELLKAPIETKAIHHRSGGGGRMLKYIKGDTAIDAANRIFGFGQWGYSVIARSHEVIDDDKKGRIEFYTADIELQVVGAAFPFPGDGVGIVTAPYTVEMHEKARKEAATDALKRALRHYGDQFGLSLYDEDDYADAGDGTMVRIGDVKPGRSTPPPNRIIEAKAAPRQLPQPQVTQPTSSINAPTPSQLRKRCNELFPGKWDEVVIRILGGNIPDDNLTPEDCHKIHASFEKAASKRQTVA